MPENTITVSEGKVIAGSETSGIPTPTRRSTLTH